MIEQTRSIFRCGHCKKYYLQKASALRHELYCGKNPTNHHACLTCKHLVVDQHNNDYGFKEKTFKCPVKDLELHSFKAEKIKHSCLGHTERMPLQCDKHEIETYGF